MSSIKGTHRVTLSTMPGNYARPDLELAKRVQLARTENPKLDHAEALKQVIRDEPQLGLAYRDQVQARFRRAVTQTQETADDAGAFITGKIVEAQTFHKMSFAAAKKYVAEQHPEQWAAYCAGL